MGIAVAGDVDLATSLKAATDDLADLRLDTVAAEAARVVMGVIPVRTGRARRNVSATASNGRAVVTVSVPYAHFIKHRFAERTDAVMETRAAELVEDEWNTIAERHGLA